MASQLMTLEMMVPPVVKMLKTKQTRELVTKKINDAIDIPMIGEATEAKIIKKILKIVIKVLEDMVEEDSDTD